MLWRAGASLSSVLVMGVPGSGVRGQVRGRELGPNIINTFIYIIYLFKVITIQHKRTFSPQIRYFNRNIELLRRFLRCPGC